MDVTKVIIPAAGLGTRFLPITKAIPKEMLPLLEKPAIHYIIEEALSSELRNIFFITGKGKEAIADYFDHSLQIDWFLHEKNQKTKSAVLKELDQIRRQAQFTYIRQHEPLGLGHAVLMAQQCIGKEYFGIMLPDDIIIGKDSGINALIRIARQEKGSVVAVQEVPSTCVSSYGVIGIKKQITPNLCQISHLVEKPDAHEAPSNLAIVGRYVLSNKIFASLEETSSNSEGELQLTDAIAHMTRNGEKVFAYKIPGIRYDIGNPIGWLKAIIGIAMQHPYYAKHMQVMLNELNTPDSFLYNTSKAIEHTL